MLKRLVVALFILALIQPSLAQDNFTPLPFPVSLAGQSAHQAEGATTYAVIDNPVSSSAALSVKGVNGQIIVNLFRLKDKSNPNQSAGEVLILMFNGNESKPINDNLSKTTPQPGWYTANIVASEANQTARVMFEVK